MFINENMIGVLESFIGDNNRFGESVYGPPIDISCIKYGSKEYKRDSESESVYADYIYQTKAVVKEKDKLDGYIVNKVIDRYDIFGNFRFKEVYVING